MKKNFQFLIKKFLILKKHKILLCPSFIDGFIYTLNSEEEQGHNNNQQLIPVKQVPTDINPKLEQFCNKLSQWIRSFIENFPNYLLTQIRESLSMYLNKPIVIL